jgi:hypothetical protein
VPVRNFDGDGDRITCAVGHAWEHARRRLDDQGALGEFLTKASISPIRRDQARIAMIRASFLP